MTEIECVARALSLWQFATEACWEDQTEMARCVIVELDDYRAAEKRKNCKHHSATGNGCVNGDGTGWNTWYCKECGTSYDSRTPTVGAPSPQETAE